MFQRFKDWWNRKEIAEQKAIDAEYRRVEAMEHIRRKAEKQRQAEMERLDALKYTTEEVEAFIVQHKLTGRPILLDLALVLERRLKDETFAHKHEMYRLRLEQILDIIGKGE